MSTSATSLEPYNIYVQGHYAYITNLAGTKLSIFDVSNPAAPVTVSTPSTGGDPTGIYVQGRYAYVTSESTNSLYILDVSNPASPVTVSTLSTGSTPGAVTGQGRYAYVLNTGSTGSNGLAIIDRLQSRLARDGEYAIDGQWSDAGYLRPGPPCICCKSSWQQYVHH